jgi:hypothetical protein
MQEAEFGCLGKQPVVQEELQSAQEVPFISMQEAEFGCLGNNL